MTINIFDRVFDVVKSKTAIKTQKDLALILEVTQQSISGAKVRGHFPADWLIKLCVHYNINLDAMLGLDNNVTYEKEEKND